MNIVVASQDGVSIQGALQDSKRLYVYKKRPDGSFSRYCLAQGKKANHFLDRWEELAEMLSRKCHAHIVIAEDIPGILHAKLVGRQILPVSLPKGGLIQERLESLKESSEWMFVGSCQCPKEKR
ncbi:hypothetical protein [Wolinella succinogenes]|uniref:hypothetical protein n=1 Tax=Wolinella succinogenes TaxID=844 RepID=UPI002FC9A106